MITLAIACKNQDDRSAITTLLQEHEDFRIINIGKDGYDALKAAMTQQPDVIIMDFNMEYIDGAKLAPIIKRRSPSTALIVLCSHNEVSAIKTADTSPIDDIKTSPISSQNAITRALKAGISGCLLRPEDFINLASSVRSVFHGGLYISKSAKNLAVNYLTPPAKAFPANPDISPFSFTPTETGIFYGIIRGQTDREIAKNLNINIYSLRNCINRTKKKTGLQNRTQITLYALLAGKMGELEPFHKT